MEPEASTTTSTTGTTPPSDKQNATGVDLKEEGSVQDYILLILLLIVIVITSVITLVYFKKIKVNTGQQQHMHDVHIEMNDILNP